MEKMETFVHMTAQTPQGIFATPPLALLLFMRKQVRGEMAS